MAIINLCPYCNGSGCAACEGIGSTYYDEYEESKILKQERWEEEDED